MRSNAHDGGITSSIWLDSKPPRFDSLPDSETEVCIVGAGIAGLTTALQLARLGVRVTVLDDGPIGGGETARTSAHLASALDDRFHVLEHKFGKDGARLAAESHSAAIDFIEQTARELSIDCDFQRVEGYLFAPPGAPDERTLDKELDAAKRAGLIVEKIAQAPLPFETGPALRFEHQAEFHPLRYLRGLAAAVIKAGGQIHTGVHVDSIEPGEPLKVQLSGGGTLLCRTAVDATNGAFTSRVKLPLRQAAYRSYVIAFDIAARSIPHGLYWDTADVYHYLRIAPGDTGRDLLIVGGSDHRVGQGNAHHAWSDLEAWTRQWLPIAGTVVTRWSGQIIEPSDGLAHIGASPELDHVFVCTGDSGHGLTHGTIAGLMLPDLIRGREHRWSKLYAPTRSHAHALGTLIAEAAKSSAPYADWVRGGDVSSSEDIPRAHGAVIRRGLHLIAAYRDDRGVLHERSATCPHLRGVVHWNAGEQTWDCPCHGSRFDAYGCVLNGPATSDLPPVEPTTRDRAPAPVSDPARPADPARPLVDPTIERRRT